MTTLNHMQAKPFSAESLQAKLKVETPKLQLFDKLLKSLCLTVEQKLQAYHATPVKCSIAKAEKKTLPAADQAGFAHEFAAGSSRVKVWLDAERDFDNMILELCLGGTGVRPADTDAERPASKIETKLKAAIFQDLVGSIPQAVKLAHSLEWTDFVSRRDDDVLAEPKPEVCLCVRLLANAFSLGSEFSIWFQYADLERALNLEQGEVLADESTAASAMDDCPFEVQAFLRPQLVMFDSIKGMNRGDIIPLEATISSVIEVHFEDAHIFDATMNLKQDTISIVLASERANDNLEQRHAG